MNNPVLRLRVLLFIGSLFLFYSSVPAFFQLEDFIFSGEPFWFVFGALALEVVKFVSAILLFTFAWHAPEYARDHYGKFRLVALLFPVCIFIFPQWTLVRYLTLGEGGYGLFFFLFIEAPIFAIASWYLLKTLTEARQQTLGGPPASLPSDSRTDAPVAEGVVTVPEVVTNSVRYWKMASTACIVLALFALLSWPGFMLMLTMGYGGSPPDDGVVPQSVVFFLAGNYPFAALIGVVAAFILRKRGWHKTALAASAAPVLWCALLFASLYLSIAFPLQFEVRDNKAYAAEREKLLAKAVECPDDEYYYIHDDLREISVYQLIARGRDIYPDFKGFSRFYEEPERFKEKLAYMGAQCAGVSDYPKYRQALDLPVVKKTIYCVEPPDRQLLILSDNKVLMTAKSQEGNTAQWPIGTLVGKEFRFNIRTMEDEQDFTQCRVTTPNFSDTIYSVVRLNSFGAPL